MARSHVRHKAPKSLLRGDRTAKKKLDSLLFNKADGVGFRHSLDKFRIGQMGAGHDGAKPENLPVDCGREARLRDRLPFQGGSVRGGWGLDRRNAASLFRGVGRTPSKRTTRRPRLRAVLLRECIGPRGSIQSERRRRTHRITGDFVFHGTVHGQRGLRRFGIGTLAFSGGQR